MWPPRRAALPAGMPERIACQKVVIDNDLLANKVGNLAKMFKALGLPEPSPIPLMKLHHQIAQKLHGITDPSQNRPHDLIDLQLIFSQAEPDLALVRNTCVRLFAYRRRQSWPSFVMESADWDAGYNAAKYDLQVEPSVAEAIRWANDLIRKIAAAN